VFSVEFEVAVMTNVLCFVLKVGDKFLCWFPIGDLILLEKLLSMSGETVRCSGARG